MVRGGFFCGSGFGFATRFVRGALRRRPCRCLDCRWPWIAGIVKVSNEEFAGFPQTTKTLTPAAPGTTGTFGPFVEIDFGFSCPIFAANLY